ncbi:MAG: hypothetical protein Kow00109_17220 [Acidobacteriota bacterium]
MRGIVTRAIALLTVAFLLTWTAPLLAASDETAGATQSNGWQVLLLGENGEYVRGTLQFSSDGIVFKPEDPQGSEQKWTYDELRQIQLKHPRLLRIETRRGDKVKLSPFGERLFDDSFAKILRENVPSDVRIRT